jgi:HTH-type transcriptional regulator / antitoxin HigA
MSNLFILKAIIRFLCFFVKHKSQFANLSKLNLTTHLLAAILTPMHPSAEDCRTPGQLIAKLLEQRSWSQRVLAIILNVSETAISKLLSGTTRLDAEMALSLEAVFGVEADTFLELQKSYDLAKARIVAQPDPNRATRAILFGELPIAEMIKRGWLDVEDIRDVPKVEAALTKFFGAPSLQEIEILPHAARKTGVAADVTASQLLWLYRVKRIAKDMMVAHYTEFGLRTALKKLELLMTAPENVRNVPRILAECGIRYVIAETIGSAKIDGVCTWLDPDSPVIGMTLRYDRIDNFWFVLRHELEHVLRGHGRDEAILDELEGERAGTGENISEEERIANEAAADFGVSRRTVEKFISRKSPLFREADLLGFANTLHIHPGIIAGRIQHETKRYDIYRNHLVKIRTKIAPSAMVDGWGEVVPVES